MATDDVRPRKRVVVPLAPVALAFAAGIVVDRYAEPMTTRAWAAVGAVLAVSVFGLGRWERLRRYALVAALAALGGAYHHHRWSDLARDDLARGVGSSPRIAWLKGVLTELPEFHPPEQTGEEGYTDTVLAVTAISDGLGWPPASGRVRVTIAGRRTDLEAGMPVTIAGTLAAVAGPTNPGEIDYRAILRAQGIRLRMSVGEVESVAFDPSGRVWWRTWCLGRLRSWSHERLVAGLDDRIAPWRPRSCWGVARRLLPRSTTLSHAPARCTCWPSPACTCRCSPWRSGSPARRWESGCGGRMSLCWWQHFFMPF